ncbi:MAG: alpha/beta fold hydrolase, partial [Pseudomonadota bacterium]
MPALFHTLPRSVAALVSCLLLGLLTTTSLQAADAELKRIAINGGELEYEVIGSGEPVLLIHGTGVAATFYNVMREPSLAGYQLIRYHRRGFAGSSRTPDPFTMQDHAADANALLTALGISKAHIVGHSFGASTSLQLALDAPELVHDLVVIEPPVFDPAAPPAAFAQLTATWKSGDKEGAMNTFSTMSYGDNWRELAARVPGGPAQVMADVDTVFTTETPAMTGWVFNAEKAATIKQPIIYITGVSGHGASLKQLQQWMPQMQSQVIPEVTHA